MNDCWCIKCDDAIRRDIHERLTRRFIVCPDCGNKRCPKASDHELACTRSNVPGQPGSVYT